MITCKLAFTCMLISIEYIAIFARACVTPIEVVAVMVAASVVHYTLINI